ncbi:hypothetical protein [Salinispira pacifica]|uniref:Uncharacterized protein n=1 Tax=Salinispira pacifica TaxID=1307761 RepID=V5WDP7_9SPIO|nr:hypothetical protein [Salinispira pacifica]AHC13933.1 hypothetical protein L21SP2_0501 [Salinispira pacifica]
MQRTIALIILSVFLMFHLSASEGTYGPESAQERILISYEPTRFKNRLLDQLLERINTGDMYIQVTDHSSRGLEGLRAQDFDAVFITNSGATAKVRPWVIEWLNDNGGNPENVILHTTQITDWEPKVEVDSVTSASYTNRGEIESLAEEFVREIRSKLSAGGGE